MTVNPWLKEGAQSKRTRAIQKTATGFRGSEYEKIRNILQWMNRHLEHCHDSDMVTKIFATRTADRVIKDKLSMGCHDEALVFAVLARCCGIPAKYIAGINKQHPSSEGHCVVEVYIGNEWLLVDQSRRMLDFEPKHADFYRKNYVAGVGIDSWDINIKTFKDWKRKSKRIVTAIANIKA